MMSEGPLRSAWNLHKRVNELEEHGHELARFIVNEHYGAAGDHDGVDRILIKMGYISGLSEDTYYQMQEDDDE